MTCDDPGLTLPIRFVAYITGSAKSNGCRPPIQGKCNTGKDIMYIPSIC
jgi:hypothetical protein